MQWHPSGDPDRPLAYLPLAPGEAEALSPTEDGEMVWTSLEAVTRHPPLNKDGTETLLRVTTRDGRTVDVTKAKSVLVHRDGKMVPVDGDELRIGDEFCVSASQPTTVTTLDVNTVLAHPGDLPTITLDLDFGFLVGAYMCRGTTTPDEVHIPTTESAYINRVVTWGRAHGVEDNITGLGVIVHSKELARVMRHGCGSGCNKHVPSWAFTAPREFVVGMVDAYISGCDQGVLGSTSRHVRDGMSTLLSNLGLNTRLHDTQGYFSLDVPNIDTLVSFIGGLTLPRHLPDTAESHRWVLHDVVLDPVVAIQEVEPTSPWVYDLTVEGTRNMTAGNGIGCRDTFHTAGVLAHTVTQGVPRLKELIDMSTSIRTPSVHINFKKPYACHEHMARLLGAGIQHTYLNEVVATSEVTRGVAGDADMLALHDDTGDGEVIRIVLDRKQMYRRKLTVDDVGRAVRDYLGANGMVIWSEVNMLNWCVRVRVCKLEINSTRDLCLIHDFLLDNVPVHGVQGIKRVIMRSDTVRDLTPNGKLGAMKMWSADTEGSNLVRVLGLNGVDPTSTFSNDIHETMEVLGVEAATHQLLTEIRLVLSHDGAYVNDRHLQLLVDVMTHSGVLSPVTRHSMSKLGASVYTRASFEQTQDVLTWAAAMGTSNTTNGVTENIMIGNPISGGTGCVDVITRPDALPQPVKPTVVGKLKRDTAKQVVPLNRVAPSMVRPLNRTMPDGFIGKKRRALGPTKEHKKQRTLVLHSPSPRTDRRELHFHSP